MRHTQERQQPGAGHPRVSWQRRGWPWLASLIGLGWGLVIAVWPPTVVAATIVVTTTADAVDSAGDCALREAILAANQDTAVDGCAAGSGADVVVFAPSVVPGTFTFTQGGDVPDDETPLTGDLDITEDVTITGAGPEVTVINGGSDAGLRARIFDIAPGVRVEIVGVTITGGHPFVGEPGGGIRNRATLTLRESRITGNSAGFGVGGGIANTGTLTLIASSVTDNQSVDAGGGIANGTGSAFTPSDPHDRSTATIISSTVSSNRADFVGGGIWVHGGTVTVMDSTISHNGADTGGGISNGGNFIGERRTTGTVWIHTSTVNTNFGNGAGGLHNRGTLYLENSTVDGNEIGVFEGGGMVNYGIATVTNSTISNNKVFSSGDGGGIANRGGTLTVINSTVSHNLVSGFDGGGIGNRGGTLTVINSTVSHNLARGFGGGISNDLAGTVTLHNTILAQNNISSSSGDLGHDCTGPLLSLGHNLIGDPTECGVNLQATDHTGDPRLGPFTTLGLPGTGYLPLLSDSPALDAGAQAACSPLDQLGQPRADGNGDGQVQCDIGAVEFVAPQNVNAMVQFTPLPATFRTLPTTTGCPTGFIGQFQFQARLMLQEEEEAPLTELQVVVRTLTQGNLLGNAESGPGSVGAILRVPRLQDYTDGALRGQDVVDVPFVICLRTHARFTFLVDVLGVAVPTPDSPRAAAHNP